MSTHFIEPEQNLTTSHMLRRNPFTGKYVQTQIRGQANTPMQHLQTNALPTDADMLCLNPADPLLHLTASRIFPHSSNRSHREVVSETPQGFTPGLAKELIKNYTQLFERLIPRKDISELRIIERSTAGQVLSTVSGYQQPTAFTQNLQTEARLWAQRTGGDLLADVLTSEVVDHKRIVFKGKHWIAFVPYAAEHPFELRIMPKRASRNLVAITESSHQDLVQTYTQVYALLTKALSSQANFTAIWNMAPIPFCREISRMHITISAQEPPKALKDLSPEDLSAHLRNMLGKP